MSAPGKRLPLDGIKVLELGSLIAGPYAATLLAQFGAEVVKVEPPGKGDPIRKWRKLYDGVSLWWYSQNRNKKSVTIDLRKEQGQQLVRALIENTDIVIENFKPGTLEQWHLGWEDLSRINPNLVMVRVSGYGQSGPYRDRPGFAAIAEAMGGLRYLTGYPDRPPVRVGVSIGDSLAGLYGTIGALLAMYHVRCNGERGQYIDVALYESVFAITESLIPEFSVYHEIRERTGASLPGIVPSNTYPCADGKYVIIAGNSDSIFRRLMTTIGRPDLAEDPELQSNEGRVKNTELLDHAISKWTATQPIDDVLQSLGKADVPSGRIYTAADIHADPQYRARQMLEEHVLPDGRPMEIPGVVPKLSCTPGQTTWLGPPLGKHTEQVLSSIGVGPDELERLRNEGIV